MDKDGGRDPGTQLQTKKHQGLLATPSSQEEQGKILPYRFQRVQGPAGTLMWDFKPSKLYISVALSHFVVFLFQQPQETNTSLEGVPALLIPLLAKPFHREPPSLPTGLCSTPPLHRGHGQHAPLNSSSCPSPLPCLFYFSSWSESYQHYIVYLSFIVFLAFKNVSSMKVETVQFIAANPVPTTCLMWASSPCVFVS